MSQSQNTDTVTTEDAFAVASDDVDTVDSLTSPLLQLQKDIALLLQQKSTQLSAELRWQTSADLTVSHLDGSVLYTPLLQCFINAETKRQLWQLLNNGWSDV